MIPLKVATRRALVAQRTLKLGQLTFADAAHTLSLFMVDGLPDAARFREVMGKLMETASRACADVLWQQGKQTARGGMEPAARHPPLLALCAYAELVNGCGLVEAAFNDDSKPQVLNAKPTVPLKPKRL